MCTVTWSAAEGGYCLLFNRDEKLTRAAAEPPSIHTQDGVRFAAPIDTDGGGTWIAANEFGLTVGLLNAHPKADTRPPTAVKSRGGIALEVGGSPSLEDVAHRMSRIDLGRFAPFRLLALQPDRSARLIEWSGSEIALDDCVERLMPLTSSSFRSAEVAASRRASFRSFIGEGNEITPPLLERFHSSHYPGRGARSVCMHRADAQTVSFSRVTVTASEVHLDYSPDSPCRAKPSTTVHLPRCQST